MLQPFVCDALILSRLLTVPSTTCYYHCNDCYQYTDRWRVALYASNHVTFDSSNSVEAPTVVPVLQRSAQVHSFVYFVTFANF
jgi:hypothetical protein